MNSKNENSAPSRPASTHDDTGADPGAIKMAIRVEPDKGGELAPQKATGQHYQGLSTTRGAYSRRAQTDRPPVVGRGDVALRACCRTVRGVGRRTHEDAAYLTPGPDGVGQPFESAVIAPRSVFSSALAVVDGASAEPAGELAAAMTAHRLRTASPGGRWPTDVWARIDAVGKLFRQVNAMVHDAAQGDEALGGMAASATLVTIVGAVMILGHAGHTGAMLVRRGCAQRLTPTHTLAAELVKRRALCPAEAALSPFRNVLSRAVGLDRDIFPAFAVRELQGGDTLVLGTNGLWDALPESTITAVIAAESEPAWACAHLAALAEGMTKDDVTVVVARFDAAA